MPLSGISSAYLPNALVSCVRRFQRRIVYPHSVVLYILESTAQAPCRKLAQRCSVFGGIPPIIPQNPSSLQSYKKKCTFANLLAEKLHVSAFLAQEYLPMLA